MSVSQAEAKSRILRTKVVDLEALLNILEDKECDMARRIKNELRCLGLEIGELEAIIAFEYGEAQEVF